MESRKEIFKALIKEFHEGPPPHIIKRNLRLPDFVLKLSRDGQLAPFPAQPVIITGPRRSGKTCYLFQLVESLCRQAESPLPRTRVVYINLADDRLLPLVATDLSLLIDAYFELYPDNRNEDIAIFLDEIHHVEGWDPFVRGLGKKGIRVFMTDSSSDLLTHSSLSSVTGRTLSYRLLLLSFGEYLAFKGINLTPDYVTSELKYKIRFLLDEYLIFGSFPEVVLSDASAKFRILKDYFDIIVYKDIVERFAIRNISLLKGLIKYLVDHMASAVSLNAYYLGLRHDCRVSRETIMEYVSYLEQNDLISMAPQFSDSEKVRQVNPRRVFCLDNGLRNTVSFRLAEDEERLAKNVVFQVLKSAGEPVFYWKDREEVDFVTTRAGKLRGIIVSYGRTLDPSGTKPLLALRHAAGRRDTDLAVLTKDTEKTEAGIDFIPLWKWLLAEQ